MIVVAIVENSLSANALIALISKDQLPGANPEISASVTSGEAMKR